MPHRPGAGCLPPALVAWGAAVPTLASAGTPLTAAATPRRSDHTQGNIKLAPLGLRTSQSNAGRTELTDRMPYLCWSRSEGWGEGRRRSAGE